MLDKDVINGVRGIYMNREEKSNETHDNISERQSESNAEATVEPRMYIDPLTSPL